MISNFTYQTLTYLDAGAFLLVAFAIAWRKNLSRQITLIRVSGLALALLPIIGAAYHLDFVLAIVGFFVFSIRAIAIPELLQRSIVRESSLWETTRNLNTTTSIFLVGSLVVASYLLTQNIIAIKPVAPITILPIPVSVILIGTFLLTTRRRVASSMIAFVLFDNGITATAFILTLGVPLIIELGALLDILLFTFVLMLLVGRFRGRGMDMDIASLRELHE